MVSAFSTVSRRVVCVSTSGAAPVTVRVSSRAPTRSSTLMGSAPEPDTSRPSRRTTEKPLSVKLMV
jgi:hypothetical protein